jgi:RNA-directed DNA polymerase
LLEKTFHLQKATKESEYHNPKVNLIRYADDFIVTATDRETAEKVKEVVKGFIEERRLRLSEEKSRITEIQDGFDLLGWNFRKYKGKLLIKPSKKSMQKVIDKMREMIHKHQSASQDVLISKLNPVITGWSNYHQGVVARKAFERIDHILFQMLWMWAVKRHPNKGKRWVKDRYWKAEGTKHWVFRGERKRLKKMSDLKIVRHVSLKLNKNPYTDRGYFENRKLMLEANKLTGRAKRTWNRQKGQCQLCGVIMDKLEDRKLYYLKHLQPTKGKPIEETIFIHKACVKELSQTMAGTAIIRPCFL